MRQCSIKLIALLWLGWYLSGPLCETFDFWDSPEQEIGDVARSTGGIATLIAAVACFGIALFRKLCERCLSFASTLRRRLLPQAFGSPFFLNLAAPALSHSPPLLLRI
jgi:hypothetical protein